MADQRSDSAANELEQRLTKITKCLTLTDRSSDRATDRIKVRRKIGVKLDRSAKRVPIVVTKIIILQSL